MKGNAARPCPRRFRLFAALLLIVSVCACEAAPTGRAPRAVATRPVRSVVADSVPPDDPHAARALLARFECARCHEALAEVDEAKSCVSCHARIRAGTFPAAPADLARWRTHVRTFVDLPSLAGVAMLKRSFVVEQLLRPTDQRPALLATMPRLALTEAEAWTLARYLVPQEHPMPTQAPEGDAARGCAALASLGCANCHVASDALPAADATPRGVIDPDVVALARARAPDLRLTHRRVQPAMLARFLADPRAVVPDGLMPDLGLDDATVADLVACLGSPMLVEASPRAIAPTPVPPEPPRRRVRFAEVDARVFHASCRHCHADPDFALGDGGAGNTGGFGFRGRGVELATYTGAMSGYLDDAGHRHSLYEPMPDGTPRLVAVLLARHVEVAGGEVTGLRGMPLAMPPLPLEDIALVQAWIAQGRRP